MQYSYLCDSAENFMSAKSDSQVVGEVAFSQLVCRIFWFFNMLKIIWEPMYFMVSNT